MVALIIGMLICVGLALAVVALVAIPARRDGRDILTPKGDEVVIALKERQQSARQRLSRGDDDEDTDEAAPSDGDTTLVEATEPTHADAGTRS
ncbi:hypothetical protein LL946_00975 [Knoellia locipacati]|uniref:hypothetical protein n=1 Tax=Knoellia locipacati TaxID=882824 RepID=UPI00384C0745